ncbi:uncharacterized protein V2V93DRAFT_327818 [Kockiozyma suomiensis]|uniref:uncharacterized protein n=1 Tax=Kockiozyma suomiensis TaxID=1337062 RepID=UPI003343DD63
MKLRDPPGLDLGRLNRVDESGSPTPTTDPLSRLPVELFEKILDYIPYPKSLSTKLVSRKWYTFVWDYVQGNPAAWTHFDFTDLPVERVTPEYLVACIERSGGKIKEVVLPTAAVKDEYASVLRALVLCEHMPSSQFTETFHMDGVPYVGSQAIWGPDPAYLIKKASPFLKNLKSLSVDDGFGAVLQDYRSFKPSTLEAFSRLEELRMSMRILPRFFEFLGSLPLTVWFKNLQVLECLLDDEHGKISDQTQVWPEMSSVFFTSNFVALPEVRVFRLGGIPFDREVLCAMDQQCLDLLIRWMPKLEIFSCRGIAVLGRGSYGYLVRQTDFRWNRYLKEFDFSYSDTTRMPVIHPSCKKLILRESGVVPRTLYYMFGQPAGYAEESNGYDEDNVMRRIHMPSGGPFSTDLLDAESNDLTSPEYENLSVLDLSGARSKIDSITVVDSLARCDEKELKELYLTRCRNLDYQSLISRDYLFSDPKTFANLITVLCPCLRRISVGGNATFDDSCLEYISQLADLEYLDVSYTAITNNGIMGLLTWRANLKPECRRLSTFVFDECKWVSPEIVEELEEAGISTVANTEMPRLFA